MSPCSEGEPSLGSSSSSYLAVLSGRSESSAAFHVQELCEGWERKLLKGNNSQLDYFL